MNWRQFLGILCIVLGIIILSALSRSLKPEKDATYDTLFDLIGTYAMCAWFVVSFFSKILMSINKRVNVIPLLAVIFFLLIIVMAILASLTGKTEAEFTSSQLLLGVIAVLWMIACFFVDLLDYKKIIKKSPVKLSR